jgi:hypothetical protein
MAGELYAEHLTMAGRYRVRDHHPAALADDDGKRHILAAKWTGERRTPRAGEWYLSGAIIEAYRAPNDLTTSYPIAYIVRVEGTTIYRETPI